MPSFLSETLPEFNPGPDVFFLEPDTSVGIAEVRAVKSFLSRKPIQSPVNTVIIKDAHLLTIPAQNALLKTLEEPPGNADIHLVTLFPDQLLPTILSRTRTKPSSRKFPPVSGETESWLAQLLSVGVGERLELLDRKSLTRESALKLLDDLELALHLHLDWNLNYELLTQTRRYLKANCSVRLAVDNFALNLARTP